MKYTSLINVTDLARYIDNKKWAIIDCRYELANPEAGRLRYQQSHIPGAIYAHLDKDLCGEIIPGKTGRHPLPQVEDFVKKLENWGINAGVQVITYDDRGGALAAGRLWWMLRWLGHESTAVLNGGWQHWLINHFPVRSGTEQRSPVIFTPKVRFDLIANLEDIAAMTNDPGSHILDSRTLERFRGENEPIDPVAGHIPGARSAPHPENLDSDGLFLPADVLRERFYTILGQVPAENSVFYCGSGVTAVQNILALYHAGLGEAKLYAGSWSEWITDPDRPVETG